MLKQRLPPLEPLIAFEAAARLLSFTHAGEELHLSQAAISQQIRHLESSLQVKLFSRSHRAVQLTNEGREYQHTVTAILKQLAGATMDIQNVEFKQQLVFGCDQAFAAHWLAPRIANLRGLLPAVALRIIASDDYSESLGAEVQAAVIHGDGQWTGFYAERLIAEEVFPVCSPDYPHQNARDDWVNWLLQAQLIDLADSHWNWMNWRLWLSGNNIDEPLGNRNLQINSYPLVIDAACAGQGVALGWRGLVDDLISAGRLVRPLEQSLQTEFGYYFICRENLQDDPTILRLKHWLLSAFDADRAST
jgi:DNA-binding transcriptional LysR family regulator